MRVANTVAIVTGAAGGIGAAIAQRMLEHGARVLITDRDADRLAATARQLAEAFPGAVSGQAADAASESDLRKLIDRSGQQHTATNPELIHLSCGAVAFDSSHRRSESRWTCSPRPNAPRNTNTICAPSWTNACTRPSRSTRSR
ncbi:SDR family NAD(P)-dependent oxidoreductase [Nocardia sp. R16R-3T]